MTGPLTGPLTVVIAMYSGLVLVSAGWMVVRHRPRPAWLQAGVWTLLAMVTVQAALAGLAVVGAHLAQPPWLFLAYVLVSLALLPLCGALGTARESTMAADLGLVVAAVALLVVQWRLVVTWRSLRG